jgi:hypothetical protein
MTAKKHIIKATRKLLKAADYMPLLAPYVSSLLFRLHVYEWHWGNQKRFAEKVFGRNEPVVLGGPFRGVRLPSLLGFGSMTSKWLGTYESELHPIIEHLKRSEYAHFVDVGAADGYYAVGIAKVCFPKTVYAYDTDFIARRQLALVAKINNPVNCIISGECTHKDLSRICREKTFILCDIEGAEIALLDQGVVPELRTADICVEIHPSGSLNSDEVREILCGRFSQTHQANVIKQNSNKLHLVAPDLIYSLGQEEIVCALNESRGESMEWLWLKSKH